MKENGFALFSVLVIGAALSVIAVGLISEGRTASAIAFNTTEAARLRAALDGGIARGIVALLHPASIPNLRLDGTPFDHRVGGYELSVSLYDEYGKLDINLASKDLIYRLLLAADLDHASSRKLADSISEWRTTSESDRVLGAKADAHDLDERFYLPANRPFMTVDELLTVPGMGKSLFERLRPAITVFSGRPEIAFEHAPELLRRGLLPGPPATNRREPPQIEDGMTLVGRAFTIKSSFYLPSGGSISHEAVIRLTGNKSRPYLLQYWRRSFMVPT